MILQYCGFTETEIGEIGEVNADKFGSYTPGSLIPIREESAVLASNPDYLLVLPWHFRTFFEKLTSLAGRQLLFPLPAVEARIAGN